MSGILAAAVHPIQTKGSAFSPHWPEHHQSRARSQDLSGFGYE